MIYDTIGVDPIYEVTHLRKHTDVSCRTLTSLAQADVRGR